MVDTQKRRLLLSIATGVAASMLAGAAFAADDPVKVGFVGGLSGPCGSLAESNLHGVELAVEQLNAGGGILGRQVELIKRDSKTKPDEGAKLAREVIINEDIDVLTGVCSSSVMLAISAVSKETGTPFYSTLGNTQKANFESYQPNFWQTQGNAMMDANAAAQLVASHEEWKSVTPMGFDYEWGHTSVKAFTETLAQLRPDMTINDPIYPKIGEKNMSPYITAALSKKPDVVFAAVFGGGLVNLVKQGTGFGLFAKSNLVTLMTVDAMQGIGKSMPSSNIYGVARAPFNALMDNKGTAEFVDAYKAKYGNYPADWAVSGYDGLMFYAAAAEAAGSVEPAAILKSITEISYDGLRGDGLTVRGFDGQMNTASYTGSVDTNSEYGFPVLTDIQRFSGEDLMLSEDAITAIRNAAN